MVISIINGGFANQLYRYACAYATAKKYKRELVIIVETTDAATDPFQLGEFNLEYSEIYVTKSYIETQALLKQWKSEYKLKEVHENNYCEIFQGGNVFEVYDGVILYGTYQNQIFYKEYLSELQNIISFRKNTPFLKMFEKEIKGKESVAVHVRRGDFLTYNGLYRRSEYYKAAICILESLLGYGVAQYYIFSDDREFVEQYFGNDVRLHYVSAYGDYKEGVEEFVAISKCRHRVLTEGSSFSRMADALNDYSEGYAIYQQNGFESMVNVRKKMLFLDDSMINQFSKYYDGLLNREESRQRNLEQINVQKLTFDEIMELCKDTKRIGKEQENEFRIRKIQLLEERGEYLEAAAQSRKLWELTIGTKDEHRMHELYWKALYEGGFIDESILEAQHFIRLESIDKKKYSEEQITLIEKMSLADKSVDIVFIPYRTFNPHIFEDMINVGAVLRRIGYRVTFMVRELDEEMEYYQPYNKMLHDSQYYEDVMGHNTMCRLINMTELQKNYATLGDVFEACFSNSSKVVFLAKQYDVLKAVSDSKKAQNFHSIYWDFSNIYDAGNYDDVDVECAKVTGISNEEKQKCYDIADKVITYIDNEQKSDKEIVFEKVVGEAIEDESRLDIAQFYCIDSKMIRNAYKLLESSIFDL